MKTVYFVRHGQSEGNVGSVYQTAESPLTDRGKSQAEFIAKRCIHLPIETIVASNQLRAKTTAEIIAAKTGHHVEFSELLRERKKPSSLNGKHFDDPDANALNERWWLSLIDEGPRVEDGENFQDMCKRASFALDHLAKRPEKHILAVTHGFYMRYIVAVAIYGNALTGKIFEPLARTLIMENTGITVLRHGAGADMRRWGAGAPWQLWMWNDHAHLG
jgi:probable phosphoglycerate mutase